MTDFYASMRSDVTKRMDELRPVVDEYERLARILQVIDSQDPSALAISLETHGTGRAVSQSSGRPRPEPRGRRARQVVELIRAQPGLPLSKIAEQLETRPGYLYELLPRLAERGIVRERGNGWHLV